MPWKKSYRKKTTYRRKASKPFKRRMRKVVAKRRAYGYDGIVKHKFILNANITIPASGPLLPALIGHHVNRNAAGTLDITECTDYLTRASQYKLQRFKGVKIEVFPTPTQNLTLNRTVRSVHMASYPYDSIPALFSGIIDYGPVPSLQQRKDYKAYSGERFKITRYYNLTKTTHGPDNSWNEAMGDKGWMPIGPLSEDQIVQMGGTFITMDVANWLANEQVARVVMTYYVEFKEQKVV